MSVLVIIPVSSPACENMMCRKFSLRNMFTTSSNGTSFRNCIVSSNSGDRSAESPTFVLVLPRVLRIQGKPRSLSRKKQSNEIPAVESTFLWSVPSRESFRTTTPLPTEIRDDVFYCIARKSLQRFPCARQEIVEGKEHSIATLQLHVHVSQE